MTNPNKKERNVQFSLFNFLLHPIVSRCTIANILKYWMKDFRLPIVVADLGVIVVSELKLEEQEHGTSSLRICSTSMVSIVSKVYKVRYLSAPRNEAVNIRAKAKESLIKWDISETANGWTEKHKMRTLSPHRCDCTVRTLWIPSKEMQQDFEQLKDVLGDQFNHEEKRFLGGNKLLEAI